MAWHRSGLLLDWDNRRVTRTGKVQSGTGLPHSKIASKPALHQRQAASRYLKDLARIGVLEEKSTGREKLFIHTKFLGLLTRDSNDFDNYS